METECEVKIIDVDFLFLCVCRNDATNQNPSREVLTPPPIDWSHVTGLATPLETCACRWLVEMTGSTEVLAPEASSLAASALEFLATFYAKYTLQVRRYCSI